MNKEREGDEWDDLEEKLEKHGSAEPVSEEILEQELNDEFEEPEEPEEKTEADTQVEEEEKLTIPEQKWLDELEHRAKDWKRETSKEPFNAREAIRKIKLDEFSKEDIELFRLFRCLQKSPSSAYFKQKFGQVLRKQQRETRNEPDSTSYQFTKILKAIHESEQE